MDCCPRNLLINLLLVIKQTHHMNGHAVKLYCSEFVQRMWRWFEPQWGRNFWPVYGIGINLAS